MQYPLTEKIGDPELLVGREKEFKHFGKWIKNIPKRLSKSRVIIARRKSGKTSFVQRIFNQLWTENKEVIPFYFEFDENKMWYPELAIKYYRAFASQYISFITRAPNLVIDHLSLEQIREFGISKSIEPLINDVDFLIKNKEIGGSHGLMWKTACEAPHRYASVLDTKFLVILDEFQNITKYIYRDEKCQEEADETLAGSYHSLAESKVAPMLVTGSYAGWLLKVISQYLEAGRLSQIRFSPYLTEDEGLEAVYKYASFYEEPITNETVLQINELCMADPFFISCVIISDYEDKDLTTSKGVADTVDYELSEENAEMYLTWGEYIHHTVNEVNDQNAKNILLFLSKNNEKYFTPTDLKEKLGLDLEINEIHKQLIVLKEADLITRAVSNIHFRGLQDGTLNLILRKSFEEEIKEFAPDFKQEFADQIAELKKENKQLQGKLNSLSGKIAENMLATALRNKKRFSLSKFFKNVKDNTVLNIQKVKERVHIQREDGKNMELDIVAQSSCDRVVLVEVKKTQTKTGLNKVEDFQEKVEVYKTNFPDTIVLAAYLSLGGFTEEAGDFCLRHGIAVAEIIEEL
ncbi:hypothetical protein [Candidatus Marithrix sp. Canyon 246]|uniref:hypothetical protein n=1 Tax=Candidatus Marithrix sp. Canyon 246 TaxID=1827136 RepID=UPI000849FCE6|nr:hypothetical protein [Candidatus Marithrix sp. Canyon 246]